LPDVSSALAVKKHALSFGTAKSVMVLEANGRTRVIINLIELSRFSSRIENNSLFVEVGDVEAKSFVKKGSNELDRMVSKKSSDDKGVNKIDFRRGEQGEGEVIISLSDPKVDVDVQHEGGQIRLSFSGMFLQDQLRRRLDVRDFATPVDKIEATYEGGDTVLTIKASGEYDYLAYQADNQYVVSVKPLTEDEVEEKKKKFAFVGDKLSLNFQDIEVRSVLQLIADFTDLNLVASDTVSGRITLRLQNVPWDQALDLVLKTKGLDKRQVGNVLLIAPATEIAERERQEIATNKQIQELAPLRTEYIPILYADAGDLFELFDSGENGFSILSERGRAIVDQRTNSIILTETDDKLAEFRRLVKRLDVPVRQVLIEARIVVASADFREDIGVDWDLREDATTGPGSDPSRGIVLGSLGTPGSQGAQVSLGGANSNLASLDLGFRQGDYLLDLELSALEVTGHGEIVAQPKVITGDQQQASIESGTEIPFQEASASGATSTSFKDAVLRLEVTPHITPDDRVIMRLIINQDEVGEITVDNIPTIDTTQLETEVLVNNGETIVLGGVFNQTKRRDVSKVPFLGDLPYIGKLFQRTGFENDKTETLIFVTPRILTDKNLK